MCVCVRACARVCVCVHAHTHKYYIYSVNAFYFIYVNISSLMLCFKLFVILSILYEPLLQRSFIILTKLCIL